MSGPAVMLRADASPSIGLGHVARCRAVAVALRSRGVRTTLVTHGLLRSMRKSFLDLGCEVHELGDPTNPREIIRLLETAAVESDMTMLVDHYRLDESWESSVRESVAKLVAIDDRPLRRHVVDLLVDANGGTERSHRYASLVPDGTQIATGHDYALIDPVYANVRERLAPRHGRPLRLLVQLGSDRSDLILAVLQSVLQIGRSEIGLDVVLPSDHPHLSRVRSLAHTKGWCVHSDVKSIWHLYATVDLAVAAPGVSVWERCALGVPSMVIETTPMHAGAYEELDSSLAVTRLGSASDLDSESLTSALRRELGRTDLRLRSIACRELIDGRGADRVASLLTAGPAPKVRLRDAYSGDEARLARWSESSTHTFPSPCRAGRASATGRRRATRRTPKSEGRRLYLLEDHWGSELGFASFDQSSDEWELGVMMAPGHQDPQLVATLIDLARSKLRQDLGGYCCVVATPRNLPSCTVSNLIQLGFSVREHDDHPGGFDFVWRAT